MSSVLGSGILVLPGLAAQIAGPASLVAWAVLALASVPFGLTFATLSARRPESGGIYAFAKDAFGAGVATVAGWLFALWEIVGAPAVALIAAAYLGYAFPLSRPETFLLGFLVIVAAFAINFRGIVLSSQFQLATILSIVLLLLVTIVVSGVRVAPAHFHPFAPEGVGAIGVAMALIFWSFLGYENVSNVAEEFENPARDFPRAVYASVAIVGVLYFAIAFVTVGTGAYRTGGGIAPFAVLLSAVFGPYAAPATAILAVFIVFCVVNAYTTGLSRVTFATARDGGFPRVLSRLDPATRAPDRALAVLLVASAGVFAVYYVYDISLATVLLVASGTAIVLYVVGSAAGVRLLGRDRARYLAYASLVISLVVLPFLGLALVATLVVAGAALLYYFLVQRPRARPAG